MKARDLMIGDWVQVPCLIDNAENYNAWCQIKQLRDSDLDVIGFKELSYDEIEPIPLTPEILEKNGFSGGKYKNYCGKVFYLSADGFREIGLTMSYKDNILWCERIKPNYPSSIGDKYSIHHLDYVHQLQHALRLCGIEKEIVL